MLKVIADDPGIKNLLKQRHFDQDFIRNILQRYRSCVQNTDAYKTPEDADEFYSEKDVDKFISAITAVLESDSSINRIHVKKISMVHFAAALRTYVELPALVTRI